MLLLQVCTHFPTSLSASFISSRSSAGSWVASTQVMLAVCLWCDPGPVTTRPGRVSDWTALTVLGLGNSNGPDYLMTTLSLRMMMMMIDL